MTNESRLIEVKSARKKAQRIYSDPVLLHVINNVLDETPAIDAVEVVRCKDCKKAKEATLCDFICTRDEVMMPMNADDFCSYGEKRGDGDG